MTGPRLRRALPVLAVAAAVAAVAIVAVILQRSQWVLDAPPPRPIADAEDRMRPVPPSVVEGPVTFDLRTLVDSLEAAVPRDFGDLDQRIETRRNPHVRFAFRLHRSPFRLRLAGQTVRVTADIAYSGRVWYKPTIGPEVELSCGTGRDLPRRATVTLECAGELTRDWGVRTHSRVVSLAAYSDSARDRCRVTFLRLDVTDRVLEQSHRLIDDNLARFDETVARWPVRRHFEKMWRDLQKPLRLADSVYLTIGPQRVQVGAIGARDTLAFADLRLLAAPRVVTGPRPEWPETPLPPLERAGDVGGRAIVLIDASASYPIATTMLRRALVGRTIEQLGRRVRIRDVVLSGIGGGKVALGVRLAGAVRGRLYFTGTPGYDLLSHELTVPDLEYDGGTANVLVKGYEWLHDVKLRDFLRARARMPDSVLIDPLARLADDGMNRPLPARGTRMSGHIGRASVVDVRATRAEIRVRALADAQLQLAIDRAPSIPRPHSAGAAARAR